MTTPPVAHPIIFSCPMVRAILASRKTQTRRIVRFNASGRVQLHGKQWHRQDAAAVKACPYGRPGDMLWVRETWSTSGLTRFHTTGDPDDHGGPNDRCCAYAATATYKCGKAISAEALAAGTHRWKPSIHMPRWASRLTLELTDVRLVQLLSISKEDAEAEGATRREWGPSVTGAATYGWSMDWSRVGQLSRYAGGFHGRGHEQPLTERDICLGSARHAFANLWDSLNAERAPWDSNPWVWALAFEVVR